MKNIRKNVLFTGLGYILPLLAALATIPVMVNKFGDDLYGLYIICISLIGFMTLVDFGIGQTVIKYVSEYEVTGQQQRIQPILGVAFLVYIAFGTIILTALYLGAPLLSEGLYKQAEKRSLAQEVLRITALPLFFSYVNQFFLNICRAYHRFDFPAVIHNTGNLGGIILATVLLLMGYTLVPIMWGYVIIQLLALVSGYIASMNVLPVGVRLLPLFDKPVFKDILSFSAYTFIGNFMGSLTSRADKLLIGLIINTDAVTYYQIPYTIAQMANGIIHTLTQIMFPRFSEMSGLGDQVGLRKLYKTAINIVFLLSTAIAVMLIAVGDIFLSLWISPEFADKAYWVLCIIALYFFLLSNTVVGYWVLQGTGNAKLTAWMSIIDATVYFVAFYYLGIHFGFVGTAFALFFLLTAVPLQYKWINRYVHVGYFDHLIRLAIFAALGVCMVYLLKTLNAWLGNGLLALLTDGILVGGLSLLAGWILLKRHIPNQLA